MIIKQMALSQHLKKTKLSGTYLLIGPDYFLMNQAAQTLRKAWLSKYPASNKVLLSIETPADWENLEIQSRSTDLFSTHTFLDLRYFHKTLDTIGKKALARYIQADHPTNLLMICAPQLTINQLSTLKVEKSLHITAFYSFSSNEMQQWIKELFYAEKIQIDPQIPALITEYTQGNTAACAQAVEKTILIAKEKKITLLEAQSQLFDQCNYQLSELSTAWLSANASYLLKQLEYAYISETEPRVLLWILTQDIRQLLQLHELTAQTTMSFEQACRHLNIWSTKIKAYQSALKAKSKPLLVHLLKCCQVLDQQIKTGKNVQAYQQIEQISLSMCLDKAIGSIPIDNPLPNRDE